MCGLESRFARGCADDDSVAIGDVVEDVERIHGPHKIRDDPREREYDEDAGHDESQPLRAIENDVRKVSFPVCHTVLVLPTVMNR